VVQQRVAAAPEVVEAAAALSSRIQLSL